MKVFLIIFSVLTCIWLRFVCWQYKNGNAEFYQVIWNILNVILVIAITVVYFIK